MATAKYTGPADRLDLYEELVASVPGVERKGAANPYTSRNGWMQSFIDKTGAVSIRLGKEDRESFMTRYETEHSVQYGSVMKEFVVVPDQLLDQHGEIRTWFVKSYEWVGTLEPK